MMYPGVAPFSGGGYGGNTSCCVCRVSRFDLDRYGRLALPNVVSNSVTVVDNAGNVIGEFGKYGNFDSQYVPPGSADGKPIGAYSGHSALLAHRRGLHRKGDLRVRHLQPPRGPRGPDLEG